MFLIVRVKVDIGVNSTDGGGPELSLGVDASGVMWRVKVDGEAADSGSDLVRDGAFFIPTSDGTPYTAMCNKFQWRGTAETSGTSTILSGTYIRGVGYRF